MNTLGLIILATALGGVLSVAFAALFSLSAPARWVNALISFAIGALLGAAFLEILPHALEHGEPRTMAAVVLAGILGFFVLEKLVLWRHYHMEDWDPQRELEDRHHHNRAGMLILIGDSFHNFVDGILVAAAFMESTALGAVTAAAVIAHEIPQEVGDFLILLHSGYSKTRAFLLNLLSSFAMVAGALLAYFSLQALEGWINGLLALAAASMIYVAVADLIPGLHRRAELRATVQQVLLIGLGVFVIWGVGELLHPAR
jgi:zinc and cadmium transporter